MFGHLAALIERFSVDGSAARVEFGMHGFEAGGVDMCVDLCGADIGMAEQFLDDAEVGAAAEEVGGEAVTQDVRRDAFEQPAAPAELFDEHPEADALERLAGSRKKQQIAAMVIDPGTTIGEIMLNRIDRGPADRDNAFLHPLAQHADAADLHVEVANLELTELGRTQAARVEKFDDREVAQIERRFRIGGLQQLIDLGATQHLWQRLLRLGPLELIENGFGILAFTRLKPQKRPDRSQPTRNGAGGLALSRLILQVRAERRSIRRVERLLVTIEKLFEVEKIAAIRGLRIICQPAFGRQVKQEGSQAWRGDRLRCGGR